MIIRCNLPLLQYKCFNNPTTTHNYETSITLTHYNFCICVPNPNLVFSLPCGKHW